MSSEKSGLIIGLFVATIFWVCIGILVWPEVHRQAEPRPTATVTKTVRVRPDYSCRSEAVTTFTKRGEGDARIIICEENL